MPDISQSLTYPYGLAVSVVDSFIKKMGRAPYIIAESLEISDKVYRQALIYLFMYDNNTWNKVRDAIKAVERRKQYANGRRIPVPALKKCLTGVKWLENIYEKSV